MRRTSNSYYLALGLLVIVGCFYYSYNKLVPQYRKDKASLALVQAEDMAIDSKIQSLQNSKQTLTDLGDLVDKMLVAVPDGEDAPNLITEIEALATQNKVSVPNIQITSTENTDASASNIIPVALTANGTFSNVHQFIHSLEKDLRFMNIQNITISAVGDQFSASIQLNTYKRTDTSLSSAASISSNTTTSVSGGASQ